MFKYLELCVDLKKSHVAKEGLFQYRNMCQSVNVASLASVVQVSSLSEFRHFLKFAHLNAIGAVLVPVHTVSYNRVAEPADFS